MFISAVGLVFWRRTKVVTVNPWATGLSGQLQKAFVTGYSSFFTKFDACNLRIIVKLFPPSQIKSYFAVQ